MHATGRVLVGWSLVCLIGLGALDGCTSSGDDSSGGPGSGSMPDPATCQNTCEDAAARCQAPASMASSACAQLCASGATDAQLDCLGSSSCMELADAFSRNQTVCGIGTSTTDAGTGTQGPDGGSHDSCEIGDRECPGDFEAFRCEELDGVPVTVHETCTMATTVCEDGWCVDPRNGGAGSTCIDEFDCRAPDQCQGGLCCTPMSEVCTGDDQCCAGMTCQPTRFGFSACM